MLNEELKNDFYWIWGMVENFDDEVTDATKFWRDFKSEFDGRLGKWDGIFEKLLEG